MLDDATKQALFSALRAVSVAIGSVLTAKGYVDDATVQTIIGALAVIAPIVWGVWDKYTEERKTAVRAQTAMNAGIILADNTAGKTAPVSADDVAKVVKDVASGEIGKAPTTPTNPARPKPKRKAKK